MNFYLGIDVGSISTNLVLLDESGKVRESLYLRTDGNPIKAVQDGLSKLSSCAGEKIAGAGTTGSGRRLAEVLAGADVVKTEIIAHAVASLHFAPDTRTILEIGGQDSKIIILRDGIVVDFAMNSICAAGCGAFLDHQASRLRIPIEEFGPLACRSCQEVNIAGRCTVFAESDMIHKQQVGFSREDIISGLCDAIVRNYLNNVGKGKDIRPGIVFQGGVAANTGVRRSFEKALQCPVTVPEHFAVMGAVGAALLAREAAPGQTRFKGFEASRTEYRSLSRTCHDCANLCEIVEIMENGRRVAAWGSRCGKHDT